ncbi:DUF7573 domain-containing protein [Halobellus rufus]|uniref:DUF7573 domain-containing protein n=1 Tax=Halobellus rufus TaxID=1448860 RepID=UPI0006784F28|nr:hypothetical protein [Halobellus rufus]
MTRDRSLDEFAGSTTEEPADVGEGDDRDGRGDSDGADSDDVNDSDVDGGSGDDSIEADTVDDVEPASATYQWDPEGVECAACGRVVDRLWTDGDARVCADCKEW